MTEPELVTPPGPSAGGKSRVWKAFTRSYHSLPRTPGESSSGLKYWAKSRIKHLNGTPETGNLLLCHSSVCEVFDF